MSDQTANPIRDAIQEAIDENPVILFMKGSPEAPACGFSARTVAILQSLGARFAAVDILPDPRIRQELSAISNWPTIPQLFVDGELVGGCDIVSEMYQSGELAETLGLEAARPRRGARRPRPEQAPLTHREPAVAVDAPARGAPVATAAPVVALRYADGALWALDQTQLPWREVELELRCADDVVGAIRRLSIRGRAADRRRRRLRRGAGAGPRPGALDARLRGCWPARGRPRSTWPTPSSACVPPCWPPRAGGRRARRVRARPPRRLAEARAHARRGGGRQRRASPRHGADLLRRDGARILTHCNTGALAAPGPRHGAGGDRRAGRPRRAGAGAGRRVAAAAAGRPADRLRAAAGWASTTRWWSTAPPPG